MEPLSPLLVTSSNLMLAVVHSLDKNINWVPSFIDLMNLHQFLLQKVSWIVQSIYTLTHLLLFQR
jgi:hypothetical protein